MTEKKCNDPEDKIVYWVNETRVLRGRIVEETDDYVIIERRDGRYKIMMNTVQNIKRARRDENATKE